jgi:hypothetical protein
MKFRHSAHWIISEATANWNRPELRSALSRVFDHGPMKQSAERKVSELRLYLRGNPPEGPERDAAAHLLNVAEIFIEAQYLRNEADYNTNAEWSPQDVLGLIDRIAGAFQSWSLIRDEPMAQAYLVSMLQTKDRRRAFAKADARGAGSWQARA